MRKLISAVLAGGVLTLVDRRYRLKVKVRQPVIMSPTSPESPAVAPTKAKRRKAALAKSGPQAAA